MRRLASLVLFAVGCGLAPVAPRPRLVSDLPPDPPARKWPASQPDLAEDVDTMVRLSNEMCDCAAQTNVACARAVVIELELWLDEVHPHTLDADQLTAEQNERASVASDKLQECGDEVLGSASWGPDTSRNDPNVE
jgi:hypothetical protein